ncbi:MAG: hypothetical protein K5656_10965 [Lachnospiraceae bacterium]|nr:hypothetical protein [Lachnospiraceae bacterium]
MSKKRAGSSSRGIYAVLITAIIFCLVILLYLVGIMFSTKFVKKTLTIPVIGEITEYLVGNLYSEDEAKLIVASKEAKTKKKKKNTTEEVYEEVEYGVLPEAETMRTREYLTHCTFLGDSRTVAMVDFGYVAESQTLAEVGISHMAAESNTYTFNSGAQYTFDTYLDYNANQVVYISYGVNGINYENVEEYMSRYESLIDHVMAKCPQSAIVVQSIWPVREGYVSTNGITNAAIDYYNDFLKRVCEDKKIYYLDTSSVLKDEYNQMKEEYNAGDGLHYGQLGYEAAVGYILRHPVPDIGDQ